MDEILKTEELAAFIKSTSKTVKKLRDEQGLPFIQLGKRSVRYLKSSVLAYMKQKEQIIETETEQVKHIVNDVVEQIKKEKEDNFGNNEQTAKEHKEGA